MRSRPPVCDCCHQHPPIHTWTTPGGAVRRLCGECARVLGVDEIA